VDGTRDTRGVKEKCIQGFCEWCPYGRRPVEKSMSRWEDNFKVDHKAIREKGRDSMAGCYEQRNITSFFITCGDLIY